MAAVISIVNAAGVKAPATPTQLSQMREALGVAPTAEAANARRRGRSAFAVLLDTIAGAGGDTSSFVPAGNFNPTTHAELVTALTNAAAGQIIRIPARVRITVTAKLPVVPIGVIIRGAGHSYVASGYAPTANTSALENLFQLVSSSEGVNGNQSVEHIHFIGNNYQAAGAVYVRGRSNVRVIDCTGAGLYSNFVTFNGRGDESDGAPTTRAANNGVFNCTSAGCSVWIGPKDGNGYASGIVQYGGQLNFTIKESILIAKGRGSNDDGYGIKYFKMGYSRGVLVDNCEVRKNVDTLMVGNFHFAWELWQDEDVVIQDSRLEGWIDNNGCNKFATPYGLLVNRCWFGTSYVPTNPNTFAVELEYGANVAKTANDVMIVDSYFQNIRSAAIFVYVSPLVGTKKFSRVCMHNCKVVGGRVTEFTIGGGATVGGFDDWTISRVTAYRRSTDVFLGVGIMLPKGGTCLRWRVVGNIVVGFNSTGIGVYKSTAANEGATLVMDDLVIGDNVLFGNGSPIDLALDQPLVPTNYTTPNNSGFDPLFDTASADPCYSARFDGTVGAGPIPAGPQRVHT